MATFVFWHLLLPCPYPLGWATAAVAEWNSSTRRATSSKILVEELNAMMTENPGKKAQPEGRTATIEAVTARNEAQESRRDKRMQYSLPRDSFKKLGTSPLAATIQSYLAGGSK